MTDAARSPQKADSSPTAIPLIVGVTGHRDLVAEDVPQIRELVREVLRTLKKEYPHTPLVLLSPLAEGADQLVAEVALEAEISARLVAVLCAPPQSSLIASGVSTESGESGLQKLARGGSAARFQELVGRASKVVSMPLDDEARRLAAVDESAMAERQYELVGKYVARHSQLLIALWDGDSSESSGTARVVAWQRDGAPAPFATQLGELDVVEGAPICHIRVRRTSRPEAMEAQGSRVRYIDPESPGESSESANEQIHRTWGNIERFNRDITQLQLSNHESISRSRSWVLPEETVARLTPDLRELFEFYAVADAVALSFQARVKRLVQRLFVIGPLALVCLEVYAHLWSEWPVLAGYLFLLALAYGMFAWARRGEWEGRYLDDRALAEALRVQFFWQWAGLSDCAAEHYLRHLRGELGWIRQAARTCFLLTSETQPRQSTFSPSKTMEPGSEESLKGVLRHWVLKQATFFTEKQPINEHLELRCERVTKWSFRAALVIAAIELVVHWQTHHANHLLIVLTFFGLVAAALAEEVADYHTFGMLARQYDWMKNLFTTAGTKLESLIAARNVVRSQSLIHDLGLEALNENADWLVQRRRKPVVMPK